MHTEGADITATAGVVGMAGMAGMAGDAGGAGDEAGTHTGGGARGGCLTTGARGATRIITGGTPLIITEDMEDIILTRRIIITDTVPIMVIDKRAGVVIIFSRFQV
jgi:hypothetical protein